MILSRELSLEEIEEIQQHVPDIELEVFVHGALCILYSVRCLLSGYMNKRDANQGACTNACRWDYKLHEAQEDLNGDVIPVTQLNTPEKSCCSSGQSETTSVQTLLVQRNDEEMFAAEEDEHGTYFMNSKDLRAVQHVDRLTKMGIASLKIEVSTKSYFTVPVLLKFIEKPLMML